MSVRLPGTRWYNAVWRWHFYAGLFCIPFVIWLALTGTIYLWRPQIESMLDRPYRHLTLTGPVASPGAQVAAALKAVPGATLNKYVLPATPDEAIQILVTRKGIDSRVYLHPQDLKPLNVVTEEQRPMRLIFHLHGELLAGAFGSYLIETAACWAIVMILTGLYLWWPRGARGLGGVLWPRLRGSRRLFWRDVHAVTGIWVSLFALGLIVTGLPWAKAWGSYLGEVRALSGTSDGPVDWTIGGKQPSSGMAGMDGMGGVAPPMPPFRPDELARVIAAVRPLAVAPPVLIAPPQAPGRPWRISSDTADRPLRSQLTIDGATGRILSRKGFAQHHWIDRVVGYGVAVHEGALFGIANQILGTLTALLLVTLAVSGAVLWWRRRPIGLLGGPLPLGRPRYGSVLIGLILSLGILLPLFGATLLAMLLIEHALLRRLDGLSHWLGLRRVAT